MQISELARRTAVSVHALRHYERLGLLQPRRLANGYRDYPAGLQREVVFIAMSRQLGFSLPQIADRLGAYRAGTLTVEAMAQALGERAEALAQQIAALQAQNDRVMEHKAWLLAQQAAARRPRVGTPRPPWPQVRPPAPASRGRAAPSPASHRTARTTTP